MKICKEFTRGTADHMSRHIWS